MAWRSLFGALLFLGAIQPPQSGERERSGIDPEEIVAEPKKLEILAQRLAATQLRRFLRDLLKHAAAARDRNDALGSAFAGALQKAADTPAEVMEVMGREVRKSMVRQIFYRRYREEWIFEHPLRFCVVFDCVKGMEARVVAVFPTPGSS